MRLSEEYRPISLKECILPLRIESKIQRLINRNDLGHLIFFGSAGTGKTSLAKVLLNMFSKNSGLYINASEENDANFISRLIRDISSVSLYQEKRIIILDESDQLTENAQNRLKVPLETHANHNTFIFCCNDISKMTKPIRSRCYEFDFEPLVNSKINENEELFDKCVKRVKLITKREKIKTNKKDIERLVQNYYPDYRQVVDKIITNL